MLKCDFYDNDLERHKAEISKECTNSNLTLKDSIFVWGDSHAQALSYGIRNEIKDRKLLVDFYQGFLILWLHH